VAAGADYIGSGPAFPTATKTSKAVIGPAGIARVAAAVDVPVFAIGGVTPERMVELRAAGVDRVCAVSALAAPGAAAAFLRALA
jgi:thiamine-phosphate pyrophosphorylase